ncbi:hypothetical protein BZA05DRAFT_205051 [Tricharina praecox]|uniref:uncharacterized protein n=1 Tax=Tricharina praecox TaxID=43433 RepID=UPI00221F042E|nr:uncharacterized protein BZA05DRAFT_205051 [Tricharina praecox]KAI5856628.1 hypothetical protein BZA05DRAFT_205051 [Tricharina praecox]
MSFVMMLCGFTPLTFFSSSTPSFVSSFVCMIVWCLLRGTGVDARDLETTEAERTRTTRTRTSFTTVHPTIATKFPNFTRQAITSLARRPSAAIATSSDNVPSYTTAPAYTISPALLAATSSSRLKYSHETSFPVLSVIALVLGLSTLAVTLLYVSMCWIHKRRRDRVEIVEVVQAPERLGTARSEAALAGGGKPMAAGGMGF